jgi:hypothetical protein
MHTEIIKDGTTVYTGKYDVEGMVKAMGVETLSVESAPIIADYTVVFTPREKTESHAAKLINYAGPALIKQGCEFSANPVEIRKALLGEKSEEATKVFFPAQFSFKNSDDVIFLLSVLRHTDQQDAPKWQIWIPKSESEDPEKGYIDEHFVAHYFGKIAQNYLVQLTSVESPDDPVVKYLTGVRHRVGKALDIIKATRPTITDEEKLRKQIENVKEEDRVKAPEAYALLTSGQLDMKGFKDAVKALKSEEKAAARAAKKAASGTKPSAAKATSADAQDKIAKAKAELAAKKEAVEAGETAEAPA